MADFRDSGLTVLLVICPCGWPDTLQPASGPRRADKMPFGAACPELAPQLSRPHFYAKGGHSKTHGYLMMSLRRSIGLQGNRRAGW
jgi:hypothetical protein